MGYDVDFVHIPVSSKVSFPVEAEAAKDLRIQAVVFDAPEAVRILLLKIEGCRAGEGGAVDYVGRGLSYARLSAGKDAIHVENNAGARDLLKIYGRLAEAYPALLILDLQSGRLHNAASFEEWWSKPL